MSGVILVFADCAAPSAKGDFAFAGQIAHDLAVSVWQHYPGVRVILTSSQEGMPNYPSLYPLAEAGMVDIEGVRIEIAALDTFDARGEPVIGFIQANPCKFASGELIRRVVTPATRMAIVRNSNQYFVEDIRKVSQEIVQLMASRQTHVYPYFDADSLSVSTAGFMEAQWGLPHIDTLPKKDLTPSVKPNQPWGVCYFKDEAITNTFFAYSQYISLSSQPLQILIGNFDEYVPPAFDGLIERFKKLTPTFQAFTFYHALNNNDFRHLVAFCPSALVGVTGVSSTLEAIASGKLPYYQYLYKNRHFSASWLTAVREQSLETTPEMRERLCAFSTRLFAPKPLESADCDALHHDLEDSALVGRLQKIYQKTFAAANGRLGTRLLGFFDRPSVPILEEQYRMACERLRRTGDMTPPTDGQALRRAAALGYGFEARIILLHGPEFINLQDTTHSHRTALHWAVINQHADIIRMLVRAGASPSIADKFGKTALDYAATIPGKSPQCSMMSVLEQELKALRSSPASSSSDCTV